MNKSFIQYTELSIFTEVPRCLLYNYTYIYFYYSIYKNMETP